jgi:hypothetical protein
MRTLLATAPVQAPWAARRVLAALRAAAERLEAPLVLAALRAAAERSERLRRAAADRPCFARAFLEAADLPSCRNARVMARERLLDGPCLPPRPARYALAALRRVFSGTVPFSGGGRSTPARRAFDNPMATACFDERTPCLPCRTCSISSRTNSPACVVGALPSCLSFMARCSVSFSGMSHLCSVRFEYRSFV